MRSFKDEDVGQDIREPSDDLRPKTFRSLSSKFSLFTGILLFWVVATILSFDLRQDSFAKGLTLCLVVMLVAAAISWFTLRLLARPLALLQKGITSVREGRLEPIQVSRTSDEIEYLGESFNRMIEALAESQEQIRQHQELLEERIRKRTEELERTMERALAASHAKSEFLANVSHELRTPMNGVIGMIDIVMDSRLTPEQREQLETAQRCAYSLLALLNDILDLSKIEAGKMMLEKIPFDIRNLIEDCAKAHLPTAAQKGIPLFTDIAPGVPRLVLGDPLRVRQILANLLSNAVKFTERGSVRVRLDAQPAEGKALELGIRVTDTGTGIPADKVAHIFDKFTQADGSISRKYGGTGLGLAITRRLVEIYEGSIGVESEVGRGSTFHVTLRLEVPAAEPGPEGHAVRRSEDASVASQAGPPARILVVEDNLVNQKVVTAILRKRRYHVEVARDGREALAALERADEDEPFRLILMDVQMPVMDGLEATRAIRRNESWSAIPIVAMTAHAMNGDRERCLQAGMNGYISKPVNPAHLLATVDEHIAASADALPAQQVAAPRTEPAEPARSTRLPSADSDLLESMLQLFVQLAPERLQKLEAAIDRRDRVALVAEAQKIASAARPIAAGPVAASARFIEAAARREDFDAARAALRNLSEAIRSLTENAPAVMKP